MASSKNRTRRSATACAEATKASNEGGSVPGVRKVIHHAEGLYIMRCQISLAFAKETFLTNYGQQQDRHVEEWHDGGREEKRNRYNRDFEGFERRNEPTNVIMLRGLNALTTQEKVSRATFTVKF